MIASFTIWNCREGGIAPEGRVDGAASEVVARVHQVADLRERFLGRQRRVCFDLVSFVGEHIVADDLPEPL